MQSTIVNAQLQGRKEAGLLLSRKLGEYKGTNTVVVGIPHGGVCVASAIAEALSLPLEVMPCRKIKDPSDPQKDIGSVSAHEVFVHDYSRTIPQDYIAHQVALLKHAIQYDTQQYYGERTNMPFLYKTVILVDDLLKSSDSMIACLREIRKERPLKVIVAVPVASEEAMRIVSEEADEILCLRIEHSIHAAKEYFLQYPKVDNDNVRELLDASRGRSPLPRLTRARVQ